VIIGAEYRKKRCKSRTKYTPPFKGARQQTKTSNQAFKSLRH
jgi:hypothetical protein